MTIETIEADGLPSDRFGRRERGGIAGSGLDGAQLAVAAALIAVGVVWIITDAAAYIGLPLVLNLIALGYPMFRFRGETFINLTIRPIRFYRRNLAGQTRYRRDVWRPQKEVTVKKGTPTTGRRTPTRIGEFDLPGAAGHVVMYQSGHPDAGAFLLDMKEQTFAVTLAVDSHAWKLRDRGTKKAAYDGFVEWCNSLTTLLGIVQVDARVRVDSAPATHVQEHATATDAEHPDDTVPDNIRAAYDRAVAANAPRSLEFSNFVTLTFAARPLAQQIKDNGGGLCGIDGLLNEIVHSMKDSLENTGVRVLAWLDARGSQTRFAQAMDPVSFSERILTATTEQRQAITHPPVMGIREHADRIIVDGTIHQVFWLTEWPRNRKTVGFLDRLLYAGDGTRTFLLQLRPVPDHKASQRIIS
ncbi:MAG: SCO6880 family protein, partial [Pseudonocardiaceae bacterium]